jgi:phosphoglycerate dehydrogenase-like enzyme
MFADELADLKDRYGPRLQLVHVLSREPRDAELTSGRLRAALDVTDPEPLPEGHPLWSAPNLLLTPHVGSAVPSYMTRAYTLVGDQIGRYVRAEPLLNVVTGDY